ncbi:hypothetical protein LJC35_03470 [Parabacteroides sp. OttesenSCG-928-N08]|nr:hypothetical protein [Parabacteroides sp. OttesenSCG-928-N08]
MAHRGGVVDGGRYAENSIAALDEAIRRGYTGAEIDVRQSKDGVLYLYHNNSFERDYHSSQRADELTWEEIQQLRPIKEGVKPPVTMEHYCRHAQGKLQELMIDIKLRDPSQAFYQEVERILTETGFLSSSYFIGHGGYFLGKGGCKITMLLREKDEFYAKYGEKTKDYYFLFAGVDELSGQTIKWAQDKDIQIMGCANLPWRQQLEADNIPNAGRNIRWLTEWGIVDYQIDSVYDIFFRQ